MYIAQSALLAGLGVGFTLVGQVLALGEEKVIIFPSLEELETAAPLDTHDDSRQLTFQASAHEGLEDIITTDIDKRDQFLIASAHHKHATPLLLDSSDDQAIHVAAQTFADDVHKVTGQRPRLYNDTLPHHIERALVVGSVGSELVKGLKGVKRDDLEDKWESYEIGWEDQPVKGLKEGLVITGSDRRGTIYALYTLSEQMGVSPWVYWADTPVRHNPIVAFDKTKRLSHGEPTVKYRGLFINDEHPALWGWAQQTWGRKPWEPAFQVEMYEKWFEMMLRLKANYHWPAMWASMFDVDGLDTSDGLPKNPTPGPNQVLANRMGVVMGTSHHEPMSRNKPEWDSYGEGAWDWDKNKDTLTDFWRYGAERAKGMETLFTMGMRGDGDEPLSGASNELVQNITHTQQGLLKDVYGDNLNGVSQMWCMYKEVAGYYMNGLEVPDDVTVLFADDNYGNLMSVLPSDRQDHKAGAGIYYHVDYVGLPRDYKWTNTINLAKTWEQMNIARAFNTTSIWILNVGSLKPLELPTEHFLALAYDSDAWPRNSVQKFLTHWAEREFGQEVKDEVADIMYKYSLYAGRAKVELLGDTFSLLNYEEAERVLDGWLELTHRAEKVYEHLPKHAKASFFQQVLMLCAGQANINKLHIAVARSHLYAFQARTAANTFAKEAIDAFYQDANITETFHSLLNRKWDHMWDQTHINYYGPLEPIRDSLPPVKFVNPYQASRPGIPIKEHALPGYVAYVRVTVENQVGAWPGDTGENCPGKFKCPDPTLLTMDPYGAKRRWIDIGSGGPKDTKFKLKADEEWLKLSQDRGNIKWDGTEDVRVYVSVDWDKVPVKLRSNEAYLAEGHVHLTSNDLTNVTITVPIVVPPSPPEDFHGHVQGDGYVVLEAAHFTRNSSAEGYAYEEIEGYGRTLSGVEMFPVTTQNFTAGEGPRLEYDIWTHGDSLDEENDIEITVQIGPTNNFLVGKELAFGLQIDDQPVQEIHPIPTKFLQDVEGLDPFTKAATGAVPSDWLQAVSTENRNVTIPYKVDGWEKGGKHTISLYGMTTGMIIERIWVDVGGIKERGYSYLGPPESVRI
ncbi:hypothetical protein I317_06529 [Kwoniella heveanensis CBS 569]|uniref:Gylcosyl hydrolase 115 C-terminal domain-containing protein n=1 Tax=Kwoniella heveanensis BCC8398 TaxID=1296120 RepID=A0A1B9GTM8_9TREE|nr:hypothetical protein I316_03890 [Kwoniella heveanensis BCC8398]OCF39674.1 hypothetical protein I317_06529 [Kwoniella heveanensis CBS 569]